MATTPHTRPLYRKESKTKEEYTLCGFDIETRGLGNELLLAGFYVEDTEEFHTFDDMGDCFEFMLNHPYRYLAHNAAGYEFAYLYQYIIHYFQEHDDIEVTPVIQGDSRIVQFIISRIHPTSKKKETLLDIRDTYALFASSLADVAKSFCPELPKGEPPWNKEHDNFDKNSAVWIDYLKRDCEIPVKAYRKHARTLWDLFHVNLGVTSGSTAIRAFRTTIPEGYVYYRVNKKADAFFRNAYYGAIVLPGHEIGDWGKTAAVDVNAAYGYHMKTKLYPTGTPIHTTRYKSGELGIYLIRAYVPEGLYEVLGFNPLPQRTEKGLLWPYGTFETYVTSLEIEYARSKGIECTIIEGYYFVRSEYVFQEFAEKCQQLELLENGQYKPSTKLLRNSAYGKFGAKSVHNTILFSHDLIVGDPTIKPVLNQDTGENIFGVYTKDNEISEADYMMPHWAAFITAYQRLYMFSFIEEAYKRGAANVYVDTDSLKADYDIVMSMIGDGTIPIGNLYGQFKLEEVASECIVLGPKTLYMKGQKEETFKAKGMPYKLLDKEMYLQALQGKREALDYNSVNNAMRLIKSGGGKIAVKRKRTITDLKNSYAWNIVNGKYIVPYGYG